MEWKWQPTHLHSTQMKEAVLHPPTGRERSFRPGPDHPADIQNAPKENASQERLGGMGHGEPWNASSENKTWATKEDGTMHVQGTAFCTDETVPSRSVERKGAWKPRPMHKRLPIEPLVAQDKPGRSRNHSQDCRPQIPMPGVVTLGKPCAPALRDVRYTGGPPRCLEGSLSPSRQKSRILLAGAAATAARKAGRKALYR